MLSVILLTWTVSNCCPVLQSLRASGYSDTQIEQLARAHSVPEWIIKYAKKNCVSH